MCSVPYVWQVHHGHQVWQLCCMLSPVEPHLWPISPRALLWAVLLCEHAATYERRLPGCWARQRAR